MTFLALFQSPTDFIVNGGVFMWILLVCSFVAITVILLRLLALRKGAVIPRLIEKSIVGYRAGESLEPIRRLVQDDDSAMGQILDAVVRSEDATKAETLEVVQTRARREVVGLEAGLFILEIITGMTVDANNDGIPDSCQVCVGDIDFNGVVDGGDLGAMLALWGTSDPTADLDQNGVVDGADLGLLLVNWGPCN